MNQSDFENDTENLDEEIVDEDEATIDPVKLAKLEREKRMLKERLAAGDKTHLVTRVAHILNRYPNTRNSDITLQLKYWETYHSDIFKGGNVDPQNLYRLERLTSLARARAKIQNEYGLFKADEKVGRFRKSKEEIEKEVQAATKPDIPFIVINCDESGKSGKGNYIIVGSVWLLERSKEGELRSTLRRWATEKGLGMSHEFHFTDMSKKELPLYKEFFDKVISLSDMMSFKAIVIDKRTLARGRDTDEVISDLHYQLAHKGIEHEIDSKRVSLPRYVDFWKDKEKGVDSLTLNKIEQHLQLQFKVNYEDRLKLNLFEAIDSHLSVLVQIADLFTGCVNRALNESGNNNHKDELTRYVLPLLGLDIDDLFGSSNDMAKIIEL